LKEPGVPELLLKKRAFALNEIGGMLIVILQVTIKFFKFFSKTINFPLFLKNLIVTCNINYDYEDISFIIILIIIEILYKKK
jgi:hypothetical protein